MNQSADPIDYARSKPDSPGLAETFIRNAITYAWFQARGGFRSHLIMTALVGAGLTFLIGLTSSLSTPSTRDSTYSLWAMTLLVIQSSTIVLIGGLGIVNAIRQDANSGMHDSMRLMRISPNRVVLGYLTGASTQALNVFVPCCVAGAICSGIGGVGVGPWLWGAMLLLSTAIMLLFVSAFMGMMFKQAAVFVVLCAVFGPMLTGLLPVVPGILMLAGPAAGRGVLATRNQDISPIVMLSIVSQAMIAALFFFSTAHRFRFPLAPAFGVRRGTLLLAAWALICTLGLLFWRDLYPRWMLGNRIDDYTAAQILGTLIPSLLVSLVPALAAAREWADWHRGVILSVAPSSHASQRREPKLFTLLLAITGLIVAPAFLASSFLPKFGDLIFAIALCAVVTIAFHVSIAAIARRVQISLPKYANALIIASFLALILFPLIAEWTLFLLLDERPELTLGSLSQFSPVGVYLAAGWDKTGSLGAYGPPFIGVLAQLILAGGLFLGLRLPRPTALPTFDIANAPPLPPLTPPPRPPPKPKLTPPMALEVGIVGLPNVGKSTLFNALTNAGALAANYPFATIDPNVGVVNVPDPRLAILNKYQKTEKILPAAVRIVDIAGIVRGASTGEGLGNKFLSHIREVDAILHVVRCFPNSGGDEVTHVEGSVDPIRDIDIIDTELALADLESVSATLDKAERLARSGDKEAIARAEILKKAKPHLNEGKPLRSLEWSADEKKLIKSLGLITAKKVLYVANVGEDDVTGQGPLVQKVRERAKKEGGGVVPVCGKLESELAELGDADRQEMLSSLGLTEPALASLTRGAYELLGLQSYFTMGPKEIRAWTIPIGTAAPQAAGVIHTDFERTFIRAEVFSVKDLEAAGSEAAVKQAGKLRVEGKAYIMQDGDVVHFLVGA